MQKKQRVQQENGSGGTWRGILARPKETRRGGNVPGKEATFRGSESPSLKKTRQKITGQETYMKDHGPYKINQKGRRAKALANMISTESVRAWS